MAWSVDTPLIVLSDVQPVLAKVPRSPLAQQDASACSGNSFLFHQAVLIGLDCQELSIEPLIPVATKLLIQSQLNSGDIRFFY